MSFASSDLPATERARIATDLERDLERRGNDLERRGNELDAHVGEWTDIGARHKLDAVTWAAAGFAASEWAAASYAKGRADEREACAQLAEQHQSIGWHAQPELAVVPGRWVPFADLIRARRTEQDKE